MNDVNPEAPRGAVLMSLIRNTPITGPKAWRGADLAADTSWLVTLTAAEILAHHPEYLGLLYNGFYYIRREAALTERGVSDRPIPIFGYRDGVVSCRYIRNQINAGAVKREVPLTTIEQAALDHLDEQTRRADLRLDMDLQVGDIQFIKQLHDPALAGYRTRSATC